MLYHPMAKYISSAGTEETLFITTGADSMEQAENAIKVWRDDYKYRLTSAWVDVFEGSELVRTVDKKDLITVLNDDSLLSMTYGELKEILNQMQDDGLNADGCSCGLHLDADEVIRDELRCGAICIIHKREKK